MAYYTKEESGGVTVLELAAPLEGWVRVPDDAVNRVFQCLNEHRPFRIVGEVLEEAPPAPSQSHRWDWSIKSWVADLGAARASRKQHIDAEREQRNALPIAYQGALFDADIQAQRNISAWQTQLAAGAVLPADFVWRDANNVNHPADAAFVHGLGAAITLRGTQLYQAAWAHKVALDALTSMNAILAYDVTTGWPA